MRKASILLFALVSVALIGCGESKPEMAPPNQAENAPRPAPGTPTKDVMIPTAK